MAQCGRQSKERDLPVRVPLFWGTGQVFPGHPHRRDSDLLPTSEDPGCRFRFGEVLISQSLSRSCVIPGPRQWASPGPRERGHWLLCQGSRGTEALCAGSSRRGPSFSGVTFLHVLREWWQGSSSSGFKKMKPTGFIRRARLLGLVVMILSFFVVLTDQG